MIPHVAALSGVLYNTYLTTSLIALNWSLKFYFLRHFEVNIFLQIMKIFIVYQKGSKNEISIYRSISNHCFTSKAFEKIILKRIMETQKYIKNHAGVPRVWRRPGVVNMFLMWGLLNLHGNMAKIVQGIT